jgi:hypothetical protein
MQTNTPMAGHRTQTNNPVTGPHGASGYGPVVSPFVG